MFVKTPKPQNNMNRCQAWLSSGLFLLFLGTCAPGPPQEQALDKKGVPSAWAEIEALGRNTSVKMMMWTGDPLINQYMNGFVKERVRALYGIDLQMVSGQGIEIVRTLMSEKEAARTQSKLDMVWINGETFFQLKQLQALYGPFTQRLPNARYIDFENPFIHTDFQQPVQGLECPWGNVQFTLIYHQQKVPTPPQSLSEFAAFFRANPGKFTIPTEFTGLTLLKAWLIALAPSPEVLYGPFEEKKYKLYSAKLWAFINAHKAYFWKKGETFPSTLAATHQMFAQGELYFTMSNNDTEVDNKIAQGVFPEFARAYVLESGTIQNSHYLGIVEKAANKAGAMLVINFMISPEAQFEKAQPRIWGDGTVLSMKKLPQTWAQKICPIARSANMPPGARLSSLMPCRNWPRNI
ncbi:MAG: ABC transporter substrate-binding protein [Microscillaceae bacterium]|nr:ABC transporter substrate-binding protein [Microscillaceae bacterium]